MGTPLPADQSAGSGAPDDDLAISVRGLSKAYGDVQALDGVDLDVKRGTVLGLLGPNGAGKTTVVRILATLLLPDAGTASVAGLDVVRDAAKLRERIGLAGQYAAVDENLTGLENLTMVGRLYGSPRAAAKRRGAELLERLHFQMIERKIKMRAAEAQRRGRDWANAGLIVHGHVTVVHGSHVAAPQVTQHRRPRLGCSKADAANGEVGVTLEQAAQRAFCASLDIDVVNLNPIAIGCRIGKFRG